MHCAERVELGSFEKLRSFERTALIGTADQAWERICAEVMQRRVKTRSGFRVEAEGAVARNVIANENVWLVANLGFLQIREPVRVVETVSSPTRCGYAYGMPEGHPVSGEEAFVVHRSVDSVLFTMRSVTGRGSGLWAAGFPAVLIAQRWYRHRYFEALA